MTFFQQVTGNQTLMSGVAGWVIAQVLKTLLDIALNRSFNPERIFGSGGMPSSTPLHVRIDNSGGDEIRGAEALNLQSVLLCQWL